MQKNNKLIRYTRMRRLLRIHMIVTVLSLGAYFSVALFDPGFLSYDLRQKYHVLADDIVTITAKVLGPPVKPVVTGISLCNNSTGILSVTLDWADDVNTYTYDIDRDGIPLVTGITPSGYIDTTVALNMTYQYIVTAHGPMGSGFAVSDPISVITLAECEITLPAPTVSITSFDGRSVSSYGGMPSVSERQPVFTGTTNMPNAVVQVSIGPIDSFIAAFTANGTGYWTWTPPVSLTFGIQTFTITVIDPSDSLRRVTTSLQFEITRQSGGGSGGSKKKTTSHVVNAVKPISHVEQAPIDFSLAVENNGSTVLQGQDLQVVLKIIDITKQYDGTVVPIRYSLIDKNGDSISSITKKTVLQKFGEIRQSIPVPLHVAVGEYFLRAEILFDKVNVSRTANFSVAALPILQLGGGTTITYAELMRNLGWVTFFLIIFLLLWLLIFIREYKLYLQAVRHIAEQQLERAGFFSKRRGVVR